jgi:phosphatidylserine/phosphatidylglycerophosphate/cardiolipin synthase-like enzyme
MQKKQLLPLLGLKIIFSVTLIWASLDIAQLNKFINFVKLPVKYQKIFFSQTDNIPALLIDLISKEQKSIKAAYYSFTLESIAEALIEAKNRGVNVEIIIDSSNIENKSKAIDKLIKNQLTFYVYYSNSKEFKSLMHHKFMIFQEQIELPDGGVITGSFNCSKAAAERHWENIVVLEGKDVMLQYLEEFNKLANVCQNKSIN